jgi:chromate transporter
MLLSFLSVGGLATTLGAMQRYVVDEQQWMTPQHFADAYTLAQVAPGPPVLYVTLIGWQVAGWAGALAATLPLLAPITTLLLLARCVPARYARVLGHAAIRRGLTPITIGLVLASGWGMARTVCQDWRGTALMLGTLGVVLGTRCHPLWLIVIGALLGLAGLV